jgi:hypothetical protein
MTQAIKTIGSILFDTKQSTMKYGNIYSITIMINRLASKGSDTYQGLYFEDMGIVKDLCVDGSVDTLDAFNNKALYELCEDICRAHYQS